MEAARPDRPLVRWHGGKWRLAPWIIARFPPHRVYVEPFCGAAGVLLRKPPSAVEVLNDRHRRIVGVFRLLRDPEQAARLARALRLTPYSAAEYRACREPSDDPLEDARRLLVLGWQGHGSTGASGAGLTTARASTGWRRGDRGGLANSAREWTGLPARVGAWAERLRGVFLEDGDALETVRRWDAPDALFYCDPPYPPETRTAGRGGYTFEFEEADHRALAGALREVRGMVALSGYPCPLYDRLYAGWTRLEARAVADGGAARVEAIWLNPAAARRRAQRSLWEDAA